MTIFDHYDVPKYTEAELVSFYADQHVPYPWETEVHTRTSERPDVSSERPAPSQASDFRADLVVQLDVETEVAIEVKTFPYKAPWVDTGCSLHEGIGQARMYSHFYDLAELWHFIIVPNTRKSTSDFNDYRWDSEMYAERMYEYVTSWFADGLPFGYRLIGLHPQESGVNRLYAFGATAVELGYNPSATGEDLDYPFSTNFNYAHHD